jgi:hypothetical protein
MTLFLFSWGHPCYSSSDARIQGRVFTDTDGDSTEKLGSWFEPGIAGVEVQLLNASGNVVATLITDSAGNYSFGNLASGNYFVRVPSNIAGKTLIAKDVGDFGTDSDANANGTTDLIQLASGERNLEVDFGFRNSGPKDGIVEGTNGADLIDANYTGDPEGDRVDANDAILPGDTGNMDVIIAGNGNDTVFAGDGGDEVYGGGGKDWVDGGAGKRYHLW